MKQLLKCEIDFMPSRHLSQIYAGFEMLAKEKVIELKINKKHKNYTNHPSSLLSVIINNDYKIIYDVLDGFNWIAADIEDNLTYFAKEINADFYFKRSFKSCLQKYLPNCKIYPLGLNYQISSDFINPDNTKQIFKKYISKNSYLSSILKIQPEYFKLKDYEFYPNPFYQLRIVFFTRLWDPEESKLPHLVEERRTINKNRVSCIRMCKETFPNNFIGGLSANSFTYKYAPDLIFPYKMTNKRDYLETVKLSNLCIATTGLHGSIGWKFAEYVAASRAILSEPLQYELPGNFKEGENFFSFTTAESLLNRINFLKENKDIIYKMMYNNYLYYNNYLRADRLVFNTLFTIMQETSL